MQKKERVLVAMSGGIDSSVAALLLHHQGYEVIGITMKTWDYESSGGTRRTTGCCSLDDINDARALAVDKGFPHYIIDIREEFGDFIIQNFVDEYMAGRTPNPCVLCNTHIKWDALMRRADQLDCQFIATGHYAQIRKENNRFIISKGLDTNKDQSYVLWGLSQENIGRTLFPCGGYTKTQIRELACHFGYKELSKKGESFEICFIPDNDYRGFLKRKVQGIENSLSDGLFVDKHGNVLGKHQGYPFYTIGQRKGLGIALGYPAFVTHINPKTNTVTLGTEDDLQSTSMTVNHINLIKYPALLKPLEVMTKIRYRDKGHLSIIHQENEWVHVKFFESVHAVTPGQSAVFYEDNDLVGGGFISQ
ncbi:MAG: tRNA 2-thiouridine(34) synthase MnmA [Candidatus Competibacteraceae bacterium]|nr:tRNA 2-thiouridine(34) synthase MnmA [Candidatus Competibacteraceae bacterium]